MSETYDGWYGWSNDGRPGKQAIKNMASFESLEGMSKEFRELVHEVSYPIAYQFFSKGISAKVARQLIYEIMDGPRSTFDERPPGNNAKHKLDAYLIQHSVGLSANALINYLFHLGYYLVPIEPSKPMVDASTTEVSGGKELISKSEKHRRRLRVAIQKGAMKGSETKWRATPKPI